MTQTPASEPIRAVARRQLSAKKKMKNLMAILMHNPAAFQAAVKTLAPENFDANDAHYAALWRGLVALNQETGSLPTMDMVRTLVDDLAREGGLAELELTCLREFLVYAEGLARCLAAEGKDIAGEPYSQLGVRMLRQFLDEAPGRKIRGALDQEHGIPAAPDSTPTAAPTPTTSPTTTQTSVPPYSTTPPELTSTAPMTETAIQENSSQDGEAAETRTPLGSAKIIIDQEFQKLIQPLTSDELEQLETSLKEEGCRDPLVVWAETGILLDGHNRYDICSRANLSFTTCSVKLADRQEAMAWIIRNQFARRNLTRMQRAELAATLKPIIAGQAKAAQKAAGGKHAKPLVPEPGTSAKAGKTRDVLAKIVGCSKDTIEKVAKIKASPVAELASLTRAGAVSIDAAATVARMSEADQRKAVAGGAEGVQKAVKVVKLRAKAASRTKACGRQLKKNAIKLANSAIALLTQIAPKDTNRKEALATVRRWCESHA